MSHIELHHRQITCQRDVRGGNFTGGVMDFNFSIGGNHGWIPSKTYFRIGLTLKGASPDQNPPVSGENLAFADNVAGNLFTNCYFRAGGQDVSSIVNYASQADMCKKRLEKTGAWLDNLGEVYGMNASLADRITSAASNGGQGSTIYVLWQPPIGIMNCSKPMGSGDYRIQLNPNAFYKTSAVQSNAERATPAAFDLEVDSMELYVATCRVGIPASGVEKFALMEHHVQSKPIVNGENNLDFTVPTSTKYISIFTQSQLAGSNTQYPQSSFICQGNSERTLKSIQISYANTVKPSTRWTSENDPAAGVKRLQQRYIDSKSACGLLFNPGGAESFDDWKERGLLLHYDFMRDKDDRSTQVQVQCNFSGLLGSNNLFIVAHYSRVCEIVTDRGFVASVSTSTA